jgi:Protein of unknown function (DUF3500)
MIPRTPHSVRALVAALALLPAVQPLGLGRISAADSASSSAQAAGLAATTKTVAAAEAFLAELTDAQRSKCVFAYTDDAQRKNWSNLPTGIYRRAGLRFGDFNKRQKNAALAVLAAALSPRGYQKAMEIVTGDQVLKESGGGPGGLIFGEDEYYISFVGQPSVTSPWMIQFGGHHLALNVTIRGADGVLTPSHTAAQPATYTLNGKTVRPLGEESDAAFKLINALDATQQSKAILGSRFRDLVLGPGQDGKMIAPEGVRASSFTPAQQGLLLDLASKWVNINNEAAAAVKLAEIRANLAETYFAWSGPTAPGSAAYFRIQGPTLVIEFAPQGMGGIPTNHIHTIYRDPTNDYGRKFGKS